MNDKSPVTIERAPPGEEMQKVSPLMSGIMDDIQDLLKQHLSLFKAEVKEDLRTSRDATVSLGGGAALGYLGFFFLLLSMAHLLHLTGLGIWACYAIVGLVVLAIGAGLILWGKSKLEDVSPLPEQSIQEVKEDVRWAKNQM